MSAGPGRAGAARAGGARGPLPAASRPPCPRRQFIFVVAFTTFLLSCVDYDILFANKMVNHSQHPSEPSKVTLPDAFLPPHVCSARCGRSRPWPLSPGAPGGRGAQPDVEEVVGRAWGWLQHGRGTDRHGPSSPL